MSNMGAIGLVEASSIAAGAGFLGTAVGSAFAFGTTNLFNKLSLYAKNREQASQPNSWQAGAWKTLKVAAVVLGAIAGTSGALVAGCGIFLLGTGASFGTMAPVALGFGIATAVLLEAHVIYTTVKHVKHLFDKTVALRA
ncbi:MAG: hypothetical protein JSR37_10230 [Verrucomicrobia bacterium]|nr:hypothetical protein [Verrucomicrobiota bacterium]